MPSGRTGPTDLVLHWGSTLWGRAGQPTACHLLWWTHERGKQHRGHVECGGCMSPRRERRDPPVPHACTRALSPRTVFHRQRHMLYLEGPQVTWRAFLVLRIFNDRSPGAVRRFQPRARCWGLGSFPGFLPALFQAHRVSLMLSASAPLANAPHPPKAAL